nr:MAG TPA: hypothetical protein [Bacteriophage sp.]
MTFLIFMVLCVKKSTRNYSYRIILLILIHKI